MFVEEMTRIKESETYADELQKKAKLNSKQVLDGARAQAVKIIGDAETRGKEIFDRLIREGQNISDEQYASALEKTGRECADMIEKAKANEKKTVDLIAERIVRNSVNN